MKDFKEFIQKLKDNRKNYKETKEYQSYEKYTSSFAAKRENTTILSRFSKNLIGNKTVDEQQNFLKTFLYNDGGDKKDREIDFFKEIAKYPAASKELKNLINNKIDEYKKDDISRSDSFVSELINEVKGQGLTLEMQNCIGLRTSVMIATDYGNFEDEKQIDKFEKDMQGIGLNLDEASKEVSLENTSFLNMDESETEEYLHQTKIDNIISTLNTEDDKEYIDALKDTNNILRNGKKEIISQTSPFAEKYGNMLDEKSKKNIREQISSEGLDDVLRERIQPEFKGDVTNETKSNLFKEVYENKVGLNDKELAGITKIIDEMEKAGLYDPEIDKEAEMLGSTQFSLTKLLTIKEKLNSEVKKDQINKQDVIRLSKEYRQAEKDCDNILKMIDEESAKDQTVGNNACSRSESVPPKYRNNPVPVSKMNVLQAFIRICKEHNIDPKEYVKDPIKSMNSLMSNRIEGESAFQRMDEKKDTKEFLTYTQELKDNDENTRYVGKFAILFTEAGKINDVIKCFIHDDKERAKFEFQTGLMYQNLVRNNVFKAKDVIAGDALEGNILVNRILTAGDVPMLDCVKESGDWFSFEDFTANNTSKVSEYINKESNQFKITKSLLGTYEFLKDFNKNYPEAFNGDKLVEGYNKAQQKFASVNISKDEIVTDILNKIQTNGTISKTDRKNLDLGVAFNEAYKGKLDNNNVENSINKYIDIKNEYNSRNIFAKIFYSSVRRQSRMLDRIESKLINDGIEKADLKSAYKANGEQERSAIFDRIKGKLDINNEINNNNQMNNVDEPDEHIDFGDEFKQEKVNNNFKTKEDIVVNKDIGAKE